MFLNFFTKIKDFKKLLQKFKKSEREALVKYTKPNINLNNMFMPLKKLLLILNKIKTLDNTNYLEKLSQWLIVIILILYDLSLVGLKRKWRKDLLNNHHLLNSKSLFQKMKSVSKIDKHLFKKKRKKSLYIFKWSGVVDKQSDTIYIRT